MAEYCPDCQGDGIIDFRDQDALLAEHLTVVPLGIVNCEECEATGVVSDERHAELMAVASAVVQQALAKMHSEGRENERRA